MSEHDLVADNLPELIGQFLAHLEAEGRSARTVRAYAGDLCHLQAYAEAVGGRLDGRALAAYGEWLVAERPAAAATQRRRVVAVRGFLRFLAEPGHAVPDVPARIQIPTAPAPRRPPPRGEDVLLLLDAPQVTTAVGLRDAIMFGLMANHGLTPEELCALRWRDFGVRSQWLRVPGRKGHIYGSHIADHLLRLREQANAQGKEAPLFVSLRGGPLTPHGVAQRVERYVGDLGDRLTEHLTPRRLRDYAISSRALASTEDQMESFAQQLGFRTLAAARRRWRQAWEEYEASLLRNLLPVEEMAQVRGMDPDTLREWAEEGMPHARDERGELLVSEAALADWAARPKPSGRWVGSRSDGSEAAAREAEELPPAAQALCDLFGATEEGFPDAWRAFTQYAPKPETVDLKAKLTEIGGVVGLAWSALRGALDVVRPLPGGVRELAAELYGPVGAGLPDDVEDPAYDEGFLAARAVWASGDRLAVVCDVALRRLWKREEQVQSAIEGEFLGTIKSAADAVPEDDAHTYVHSRDLVLRVLDSPESFRLWETLYEEPHHLIRLLWLIRPLAPELRRYADAATDYYGVPQDPDTQVAAFGALTHAALTAVLWACPEAVECARKRAGVTSGARALVLEHVKVSLLTMLCAAGLMPKGYHRHLKAAPPLSRFKDDGAFCRAMESRWADLQRYRDGPWDFLVLPKLEVLDLIRYAHLTYGENKHGNPRVAREVCDHIVYLTKASAQSLLLSAGAPGPARISGIVYNLLLPLTQSLYEEMLRRVAAACGLKAEDPKSLDNLDEEVTGGLPVELWRHAFRLWRGFDFAKGSRVQGSAGQTRGSTSFLAYFQKGMSRRLHVEEGLLLHALLFAPKSFDEPAGTGYGSTDSSDDDADQLEKGIAVPLGRGGEVLHEQTVEGPDGTQYLTTWWMSVRIGCSERRLRALDDELRPRRLRQVFGGHPPEKYRRIPADARLYPLGKIDLQRAEYLLRRRKHRCEHLPDGYLTRGAIAEEFRCSPQALVYWERKGMLLPERINGLCAYTAEQALRARRLIRLSIKDIAPEQDSPVHPDPMT